MDSVDCLLVRDWDVAVVPVKRPLRRIGASGVGWESVCELLWEFTGDVGASGWTPAAAMSLAGSSEYFSMRRSLFHAWLLSST